MNGVGVAKRALSFGCRWLVIGATASSALTLLLSGAAGASCGAASPLQQALTTSPVAFVGTVTTTSNDDRTALVRVQSVWKGPRLPREVEVRGSPADGPGVLTTVDRRFQVGRRYLFVPPGARRGRAFDDNACSSTIEYSSAVAEYAPARTATPLPPVAANLNDDDSDVAHVLGIITAAAIASVAVGFVVLARWRRARLSQS